MWLVGTEELRFKDYLLLTHVTQNSQRARGLPVPSMATGHGAVWEPAASSTETEERA